MSQAIDESWLELVPNRPAQQLRLAAGIPPGDTTPFAAPPLAVFSLWAGRLLQNSLLLSGRRVPQVPSRFRVRRLWETAIRESDRQDWQAGDIAALAGEAMEADHLCEHWLLPRGREPGRDWDDDAFCAWRRQVHARMAARGWLNPAQQLRWLRGLIHDRGELPMALPSEILLCGFPEITPLERDVLDALASLGVTVNDVPSPAGAESSKVTSELFVEPGDEIRAAAEWAAAQRRAGKGRVAVAVNGLAAWRRDVERSFLQVFHPASALAGRAPSAADVHIHGGRALIEHPLVPVALDLLDLSLGGVRRAWSFARVSRWLLSPAWTGADTESEARAQLELKLRESGRFEWNLAAVAEQARAVSATMLVERVARLPDARDGDSPARRFFGMLRHWGWPGPGARGSGAAQAVEGVRQALEELEFSAISHDSEALSVVRRLCAEQRLPAIGGELSPVQVLDLQDMPGQSFDAVRVINVHADNWPPPPSLNRLIPYSLARQLPRTSPEQQLCHARAVQQAVLASAPRIVFTRAEQADGVPTAASALVPATERTGESLTVAGAHLAQAAWPGAGDRESTEGRDALEVHSRKPAPPIPADQDALRSVISVLNLQSACPWAAFLVHRLDAAFPAPPTPFADGLFTGRLVHQALERLYRPHIGQGSLPQPGEVPQVVAETLSVRHADLHLLPGALAAERRRLESLLREWLRHERGLPLGSPWELETEREGRMAGFRFTVRMDRVDRHGDGVVVLDYKTGAVSPPAWDDPRPTETQLPLYAVLMRADERPAVGIGLLSVRGGDMQQRVWSGEPDLKGRGFTVLTPGQKTGPASWDEALDAWQERLTSLLGAFRAGENAFTVHHEGPLAYLGLDLLLRPEPNGETPEGTDV